MSKMESSTKILRRILDERGVEWDGCILMGAPITFWGEQERDGRWPYRYWEHDGWASFSADPKSELFTPEQAVAATLGPRMCREVYLVETSDDLIESWYPIGVYLNSKAAGDCAEALRGEVDGMRQFARVVELKVVDDG